MVSSKEAILQKLCWNTDNFKPEIDNPAKARVKTSSAFNKLSNIIKNSWIQKVNF